MFSVLTPIGFSFHRKMNAWYKWMELRVKGYRACDDRKAAWRRHRRSVYPVGTDYGLAAHQNTAL